MARTPLVILLAVLALAPGCGAAPVADTGGAPPGYRRTVAAEGLQGPTQFALGPDGRLWVAQLAGPEGAAQGEVVAVDLATGEREVLLDGLDKPTGLAILDAHLWVALADALVRAPLDAQGRPGPVETVLADLPNNGRSQGTLTVTPQATLLYETSGDQRGPEAATGTGVLWELDPSTPREPRPFAIGLKNAYAHAVDAEGRRWTTEVGDGRFDGEPPPDELNLAADGGDYGWPRCLGDRRGVQELGGSDQVCAATRAPLAVFPAGATPTGLAVPPWDPGVLLVALWTRGEVVSVPLPDVGQEGLAEPEVVLDGLDGPQHLLALPDGALLVGEHGSGRILRVEPA